MGVEQKREAKNTMASVAVSVLTLGALGMFMERNNPFQALVFLLVTIVFMAFYAFKYRKARRQANENSRKPIEFKRTRK